jgi:two-component system response regulator DesR
MRILLADDQAKVRSALRLLLRLQPGMDVVGETAETEGLLGQVKEIRPDLILLDWELPGPTSNGLLTAIRARCPRLKVIALSGRPEARRAALEAGADAFVSKGAPPERLLSALRAFSEELHKTE